MKYRYDESVLSIQQAMTLWPKSDDMKPIGLISLPCNNGYQNLAVIEDSQGNVYAGRNGTIFYKWAESEFKKYAPAITLDSRTKYLHDQIQIALDKHMPLTGNRQG